MLIEFKAKNYKSFEQEMVLSLRPVFTQKGLDYSIISNKALCSSVIYGPNCAGKSNIIEAMTTLKDFLLTGQIPKF